MAWSTSGGIGHLVASHSAWLGLTVCFPVSPRKGFGQFRVFVCVCERESECVSAGVCVCGSVCVCACVPVCVRRSV